MRLYQNDPEIVKQYFLIHSSPEVVQNFIEQRALAEKNLSYFTKILDSELEAGLLKRNEPLIDLALAKYGSSLEIFKKLYPNAPEAIQLAILSNHHIFNSMQLQQYYGHHGSWMNLSDVAELIKAKNNLALFTFFSNLHIDADLLNDLYDKAGIFQDIEGELWRLLIHYTAENKKIHDDCRYHRHHDIDIEKIWGLLKHVPTTKNWAITLHILLTKIPIIDEVNETDHNIEKILERWNIKENEKPFVYNCCPHCSLAFCDPFEEVRICIASSYDEVDNQSIKLNEKLAKSLFYRRVIISNSEELEKTFEKENDKPLFLKNILHNKTGFKNSKIRDSLEIIFNNYGCDQDLREQYGFAFNCACTLYKKIYPEWFMYKEGADKVEIEKLILQRCETIDKEIAQFKDFFTQFCRTIHTCFWVFVPFIIVDFLVKKWSFNYFSHTVSTLFSLIGGIITMIISIQVLIKNENKKKDKLKIPDLSLVK